MFVLLLLYSVIYFCRTGEYVPILGYVALLSKIRHEALAALFLLFVIALSVEGKKNIVAAFQNSAWRAYTLFLVVTFLTIPFAVWPGYAFSWFIDFFKLFLFCIMIVACIRNEEEFNKYMLLYIWCMVYVASGPIQNYISGNLEHDYATGTNRITSPIRFYKNPNVLACTLLQCMPFIYYKVVYSGLFRNKIINGIWLVVIAAMIFVVVTTGSRGGILILVGTALFICYRSPYRKSALAICILVACVIWFAMGEEFQQRYLTILELGQSDKPAMDRILGLKHGFQMMLANPITGVGIGCYHHARWHMFEYTVWAHSFPGQLMGELGIPGTITFLAYLYLCCRNTRRARRILTRNHMQSSMLYHYALALEASLVAQIINGIGQHSLYLFGFYIIGAFSVVLLRLAEKKVKELPIKEGKRAEGSDRRVLFSSNSGERRLPAP